MYVNVMLMRGVKGSFSAWHLQFSYLWLKSSTYTQLRWRRISIFTKVVYSRQSEQTLARLC